MSSIFDIFTNANAQDAANAQIAGINTGQAQATGNINQALAALQGNAGNATGALQSNYTAGLQPFLQNYGTATAGVDQLKNLLGFGPGGSQGALDTLRATPGYQFAQTAGDASVNAAEAASGNNFSGKQLLDLSKFNQGLADTTYNNYVSQLQPFLGASNAAAGGIGSLYSGVGDKLAGVFGNLGTQSAGQYDTLAGLNWNAATGIGNANANADLAKNQADKNIWGALGAISPLASSVAGSVGGSSGGPNLSSMAPMLMSMFSDERLKEFIEPVGELYDGTNVYRYNYKGDPTPRIGLIAQEIEKTRPDAVIEIGGYKALRYDKATDYAAGLARFLEAA
jgi:hypothetical protein